MNWNDFFSETLEYIRKTFKDVAKVSVHEVIKNNGMKKTGICVTRNGSNCGPTIYIEDFYEKFCEGMDMSDVKKEITEMFETYSVNSMVNMDFLRSFEGVHDKICFRLVGGESNKERLEAMPHRMVEDLAVIYYVPMNMMGVDGLFYVKNEHLGFWGVEEEDLYEAAMDNTPALFPAKVEPIGTVLDRMTEMDGAYEGINETRILVATNNDMRNGAAVILYPGLLKEAGDYYGENFFVLPCSVHELLFVPEGTMLEDETSALTEMVKSVNLSCIEPEDILSNNVYYCDRTRENSVKKVELRNGAMVL